MERELERLVQDEVIEPVLSFLSGQHPLFPVVKPNGSLKICGEVLQSDSEQVL